MGRLPPCMHLFIILLSVIALSECKEPDPDNKFRQREATDDNLPYPNINEEALTNTQCPQFLELRWQTEISSSIYATPLIEDINSDGKLEVVIPSFVHQLEVLDGSDGEKVPGWPASHQSTVHSSPLMYDIDNDGSREVALATYNGEILFFRSSGYLMSEKLVIPRFRAVKNWYVGLKADHADRSHPDVHDDSIASGSSKDATFMEEKAPHLQSSNGSAAPIGISKTDSGSTNSISGEQYLKKSDSAFTDGSNATVSMKAVDYRIVTDTSQERVMNITSSQPTGLHMNTKIDAGNMNEDLLGKRLEMAAAVSKSSDNVISSNVKESRRRLLENTESSGHEAKETRDSKGASENVPTVENDQGPLEEAADASFDVFRDEENTEDGDDYQYDYDDYGDDSMWGEENWREADHEKEEEFVDIDAHILCTPVIADIDKDGIDEMIVATSYFFDREYYDKPENAAELGQIDLGKYVAGRIVVFNLQTKQVKWNTTLDLSTDEGLYRAYIYSSPTVVDLDNDGFLDIIVGTSFGFVYVLDHKGQTRENFPLQMGEIQGQILAADINDDGKIEIVTTDTRGNVAAWTGKGKEIWEVHVKSLIAQGPTAGDVDGDGHTDIVVPTISGNIYVLKGVDGTFVRPFPFRTHGRVMSPVLLIDLHQTGDERKGLTLITSSFDGYLYVIDGQTACTDVVDIGETSYSMVLASNVDGGDDLDLIVTTMNGNVFCFSTPIPYHPLKGWPSQNQGRNVLSVRYNREGIFALPLSRSFRDQEGDSFWIHFNIVDQHRIPSGSQSPYNVTATLLVPGNYMGSRRITENQIFYQAGVHQFKMAGVPVRTSGMVMLEMVDKNGLYFVDQFALTFHMHYYRLLKWLIAMPMVAMFGLLLLFQPQEGASLPSFSRDRHQL